MASRVVFGHSENIIDRRYAVVGSVENKPVDVELGVDLLGALSSKMKSVETDQSVISNRLRILKLNDAK